VQKLPKPFVGKGGQNASMAVFDPGVNFPERGVKFFRNRGSICSGIYNIMLFPIKKEESVAFFNLINQLHEQCSIIITTNKTPKEWAESLEDEVLAGALLDRLLFHCEVIKLTGNSYRQENRKTIFQENNNSQQ
jgi:hypothetical protein